MKQTFRTCPQCQARNKLTWEFCARCGESLEQTAFEPEMEDEAAPAEEAEYEPAASRIHAPAGPHGAHRGRGRRRS